MNTRRSSKAPQAYRSNAQHLKAYHAIRASSYTSMKILELANNYRAILSWNGESVSELYDYIVRITKTAPVLFTMPVPFILKHFYHRVTLRFDLSRLDGDVLTIDKHGRAIVRTLTGLAIVQLATI